MIAQALVSLLNIGAFRLAPPRRRGRGRTRRRASATSSRHATRSTPRWALLSILERRIPQDVAPLRDALSQLQMAYAREAQARPGAPAPAARERRPPRRRPQRAGRRGRTSEGPGPGAVERPAVGSGQLSRLGAAFRWPAR